MVSILVLIDLALSLYSWIIIIAAVMSWLLAFNVLNARNGVVAQISDMMWRLTEPVLRPIRRFLPNLGGIDISPIILLLLIFFTRDVINRYLIPSAPF